MLKVSVLMSVYNCEKYLDESIKSVLGQTMPDFELILTNDASTDCTDEIIRRYLDDARIVYIKNEERKGFVHDMNHSLQVAKAPIVARMDGDDICAPNRFEEQLKFLEANEDIVLVGSFCEQINENGKFVRNIVRPVGPDNIKKVCFYYGAHQHSTVMFRKDVVMSVGAYREEFYHSNDIDLFFRLIYSGYKTDNMPQYLLKYRVHSDSSDKYFKEKGTTSLRLKKSIIKEFNLKLNFVDRLSMYGHFMLDMVLPARLKRRVETMVKSVVERNSKK